MDDGAPLQGRTALVTGAGRRLGRAFALGLARAGADVAIHFHGSQAGAQDTAAQARAVGRRAELFAADLGDVQQAITLISQVIQVLPGLDILVNSASIFEPLTAETTDLDAWVRHMRVNLTAPFFMIQAFAQHLAGRDGTVVNILDWRALRPGSDHVPYTISKAGLAAATRSLAQSYAPWLRVNALALGAILPPSDAGSAHPDQPIEGVPAGRWGTVEEAVDGLVFLVAGPSYMTGQVVNIDGGRHLI